MTILDDLRAVIASYPTDSAHISIRAVMPPDPIVLGVPFQFAIGIDNKGELEMANVRICAHGSEHVEVGLSSAGPWGTAAQYPTLLNVAAHQTFVRGGFWGRAKKFTRGPELVITPHIVSWDAKLDHILNGHSVNGPFEGGLVADIKTATL